MDMLCTPLRTPIVLLAAVALSSAVSAAEKVFKADARLVGNWEVSWIRGDPEHRLAGIDAIGFWDAGTLTYEQHWRSGSGSYKLDPSTTPNGIDVTFNAIGAKTARGIYRFDGETLIVCVSAEADDARPTGFDLPPDSKRVLLVLQRSPVKHRKKDEAAKLLAEFKDHAGEFDMTIAVHVRSAPKADLRSITLHSSGRRFEPSGVGPSGQPLFKHARITKEQAIKLMEALDGWPAFYFRTAQDKAKPLRERPPYFSIEIGYGPDAKPGPKLHLAQDYGWHTIAQFGALGQSVDGDAAKLLGEIESAIRSGLFPRAVQPAKQAKNVDVLLVNGKPAADRFETATEYLSLALLPGPKTRIVSAAQFADADMQGRDCIFLCDVPSVTPAQAKALEAFVKRGGGLVIGLGPRVDLAAYNANLFRQGKGLLPVKLLGKRDAQKDHAFHFAAAEEAYGLPPLAAFKEQADRLTLVTPRFASFIRIEEPAAGSKARVIASFATKGEPGRAGIALLEWRPFGQTGGRVVLLTSTLNMDWTSWPGSRSFGPMAHELLRLAVADAPKD
jgi:uncharacterized protein (TIGR03067 family)